MRRREKVGKQAIVDRFCSASNLRDVAGLLRIAPQDLSYILYKLNGGREKQYTKFEISKRSGGTRTICSPSTGLKQAQRRLSDLLEIIYWEKPSVHSFLKKRSIFTNAKPHTHKSFVFNADLKDFFPSINFGRVRGLFKAAPYNLNEKAATVLAQIACYENSLPQGSPCSPIISNMICAKLDTQLQRLAKEERCTYTRYADDITFSTNLPDFPKKIGYVEKDKARVGRSLKEIIELNGFKPNDEKTRLQVPEMRQEVTGLIVNKFLNVRRNIIRQTRAMIHAWEKFGLEKAEQEYYSKYWGGLKKPEKKDFKNVLRGKIAFIRMIRADNRRLQLNYKRIQPNRPDVSTRLMYQFWELLLRDGEQPIIRTEGITDWMHLRAAWKSLAEEKKYEDTKIDFLRVKDDLFYGNTVLMAFCERAKQLRPFRRKIICIFDSDDKSINKRNGNEPFRFWGNNVYSLILPSPSRCSDCISKEQLYQDDFVKTRDKNGRRLFLSNEFNSDGTHNTNRKIVYGKDPKSGSEIPGWRERLKGVRRIIDTGVYRSGKSGAVNIALTKFSFALNVVKQEKGFDKPDLTDFYKVFDLVKEIVNA